ncbi:MAG TPA: SMI1/KNR4 family protein [Chryseosolibacter sp.]|nr:SMI1/KNR4 family protein [Chryseosolibacter sp.]
MKQLQITRRQESPTPDALAIFEKENGVRLPLPYKTFLLEQNPYTVRESVFTTESKSYEIHHFYPFDPTFELSVQKVYNDLNGFFENKYLAFADDSGGWQYVISVQSQDFGYVYFCRMDEELSKALTPIAKSFEDFINGLK